MKREFSLLSCSGENNTKRLYNEVNIETLVSISSNGAGGLLVGCIHFYIILVAEKTFISNELSFINDSSFEIKVFSGNLGNMI